MKSEEDEENRKKNKKKRWQSLEKFEGGNVLVAKPYVVLAPN